MFVFQLTNSISINHLLVLFGLILAYFSRVRLVLLLTPHKEAPCVWCSFLFNSWSFRDIKDLARSLIHPCIPIHESDKLHFGQAQTIKCYKFSEVRLYKKPYLIY